MDVERGGVWCGVWVWVWGVFLLIVPDLDKKVSDQKIIKVVVEKLKSELSAKVWLILIFLKSVVVVLVAKLIKSPIEKNPREKVTAILKIDFYLKKCARDIEKCASNLDQKKKNRLDLLKCSPSLHFENIYDISKSQLDQNPSSKNHQNPSFHHTPKIASRSRFGFFRPLLKKSG